MPLCLKRCPLRGEFSLPWHVKIMSSVDEGAAELQRGQPSYTAQRPCLHTACFQMYTPKTSLICFIYDKNQQHNCCIHSRDTFSFSNGLLIQNCWSSIQIGASRREPVSQSTSQPANQLKKVAAAPDPSHMLISEPVDMSTTQTQTDLQVSHPIIHWGNSGQLRSGNTNRPFSLKPLWNVVLENKDMYVHPEKMHTSLLSHFYLSYSERCKALPSVSHVNLQLVWLVSENLLFLFPEHGCVQRADKWHHSFACLALLENIWSFDIVFYPGVLIKEGIVYEAR